MNQELKQRLVGAVVITALAAIFVPMLFDDPVDETGRKINELKIPELPSTLQRTHSLRLPESSSDILDLPLRKPLTTLNTDSEKSVDLKRWFLQVGVFSQKKNALTLQDKLRKQGFSAAIVKVATRKGMMYRVKVGPEMSKTKAEQIKDKLKQLNNLNSFISED